MPDDRYLDGDPRGDSIAVRDPGPFIAHVQQTAQLILDLTNAGRHAEVTECAIDLRQRAVSWLKDLEQPPLPQVDVEKTPAVFPVSKRVYKARD